jgi:hypothetical protein
LRAVVAGASFLTVVLGWLCTGTLAAYAVGLDIALVLTPCRYLANCDHGHFLASFLMLDGAPRQNWEWSVVLRRTLYPILSYPFMKVLGFDGGGIVANFLLAVAALVGFTLYLRRQVGERGAMAATLLLATYPGLHYWIGLPYCYAIIVPGSICATVMLWELQGEDRTAAIAFLSLGLGALYLGYDLAIFFGPAALWLVWRRNRRASPVALAALCQALPSILNLAVLRYALDVPLVNSNSEVFGAVLASYAHPGDLGAWGALLARAPLVLLQNALASNFVWLPLLFVGTWLVARRRGLARLEPFELAVLVCAVGVWALNNLAPPYPGKWQMRGEWIARLYQPTFGVMLTFLARFAEAATGEPGRLRRWSLAAIGGAVVLNALVMLGPFVSATRYTGHLYEAFYAHAPPHSDYGRAPTEVMVEHLEELGRRPLGLCGP